MKTIARATAGIAILARLAAGEKTAGEAFKNVVVLRDTPQSQFLSAMTLISGSLGVACTHCHEQQYERDGKEAKVAARKMIQMTLDLNAKNFGGKPVVTCNTCHQGATHTTALAAVWDSARQLAPAALASAAKTGDVLPAADQIVANYRKAVGADGVKSMHLEGFLTNEIEPRARAIEVHAVFPNQAALAVTFSGVQNRLVINDTKAWSISPRGAQEVPVEQARVAADLYQPVKSIAPDAKREAIGIEQVDGRSCFRVDSTTAQSVSRLYFDRKTGLLYKVHSEYPTPLGPEPVETMFDDYADVSGIKMPFRITRVPVTDRVVYRFSKIELNIEVDPGKFAPPPVAK